MIPIVITADMAGDSQSRREMGAALFPRITLRVRPPVLTRKGKLAVAIFCAERLQGAAEGELDDLLRRTLELGHQALDGQGVEALDLERLTKEALELQRIKVVPVQKGSKSKMGVPDEEACRRRGAQAVRALLDGISDNAKSQHLCPTVAGEVAWTLGAALGLDKAVDFCVDLAAFIHDLPPEMAEAPQAN